MSKPVQLQFKTDTAGIEFRNAKFDFFAFDGRYITDCSFYQCEMQSAFAANSRISASDFIQSDLRFADFRNVRMQQVRILDCDVYGADFRNCQMQECHIDGVDFTYANTEGMIIGGKIFDAQLSQE